MNNCLYTNRECEKAREDGECCIGFQNCGWGNWKNDNYDTEELDLFDMLDEDEEE